AEGAGNRPRNGAGVEMARESSFVLGQIDGTRDVDPRDLVRSGEVLARGSERNPYRIAAHVLGDTRDAPVVEDRLDKLVSAHMWAEVRDLVDVIRAEDVVGCAV